jgi:uncharacterized repeat protein (TIGR03803 family)
MKSILLLLVLSCLSISDSQAQTELWGMTSQGGQHNKGVIFKTDGGGNNYSIQYDFIQTDAANAGRGHFVQTADGKLYGMTNKGGLYDEGALFQYDPSTEKYTKKIDFNDTTNGSGANCSLLKASDGMLYGLTTSGGANTHGVLFQYDPSTSAFTKKYDFTSSGGSKPSGTLIQASDGMLYGMTSSGGINSSGVVYQYNPITSVYTKKADFDFALNGSYPLGSLLEASDGMFYGMTHYGGSTNYGCIFQFDPATSTITKKIDLDHPIKGGYPGGSFIQASNGVLYGTTSVGGANGDGTFFQYTPSTNNYLKIFDFDANGKTPYGNLVQATDGMLYGMTFVGGSANGGIIFQYNIASSTYTKKYNMTTLGGSMPFSDLMQASDGKLYAMTSAGGSNGKGALFQYDISTFSYLKKLDLGDVTEGTPHGSLMKASDGMLYGMVKDGKTFSTGALFQLDPASCTYSKKHDFDGGANGRIPEGSLIQATNGFLYGMSSKGGTSDNGILFKYDIPTSSFSTLWNFTSATGTAPHSSLIQATDGMLYGTTYLGGTGFSGVLFQFNPLTSTYTKKIDFIGPNGTNPVGCLMQASDGMLYGMTMDGGGPNGKGTIYQYNPLTSTLTVKIVFDGPINGAGPHGNLIQGTDGMLYGMTNVGGSNNLGVLFHYFQRKS